MARKGVVLVEEQVYPRLIACPRPLKVKYRTHAKAMRAATRTSGKAGVGLRVYICDCGFWHLSKKRKGLPYKV